MFGMLCVLDLLQRVAARHLFLSTDASECQAASKAIIVPLIDLGLQTRFFDVLITGDGSFRLSATAANR